MLLYLIIIESALLIKTRNLSTYLVQKEMEIRSSDSFVIFQLLHLIVLMWKAVLIIINRDSTKKENWKQVIRKYGSDDNEFNKP